jgi:hypothetical protein
MNTSTSDSSSDPGQSQPSPAPGSTKPQPTPTTSGAWWKPAPGLSWQIQLSGTLDTSVNVQVFDIDLFDVSAETIAALKGRGARVICYFSAGSFENWRSDASAFPESVKGNDLDNWPGEKWLDVRQVDALMTIMTNRMDLAKQKGCDGVDPDNVDGYSNKTGFAITAADQLQYNRALANAAHARGLAVGLKNDLEQIGDLISYFDFAVNEQCYQYGECDRLNAFIAAKKPVFGIEYSTDTTAFCTKANAAQFDFLKKKLALDSWRQSCR